MSRAGTTVAVVCCAASALCAGSAAAQSSVGISGWLNLGLSQVSGQGKQIGTVSRSSLAFAGVEDLGGGLAATFRLSTHMELDTGSTENGNRPFWQGESTVGLKGGWGALRLGRALSPIGAQDGAYDAWYVFDRIASPAWWFVIPDFVPDPRSGLPHSHDYGRISNALFYDSPDLQGFHFHLSTAAGEGESDLARHYGSSFNYDKGPLSLMFGAEQNSQRDRAYLVGAAYQLGRVKLMTAYSQVRLNPEGEVYSAAWTNWAAASRPATKRSSLVLSGSVDVGHHAVLFGAGRDFQGSTSGFNYIASSFASAGTHFSGPSNFFGLGYVHNLSRRSSLFIDLARVRWQYADDDGRRGASGMAVGMTHAF